MSKERRLLQEWLTWSKSLPKMDTTVWHPPKKLKIATETVLFTQKPYFTWVDNVQCDCSWDYITGESPNYYCGKCGQLMHK